MVILQFNKLIRNKWVWGAFAIAISLFFAFDFLIDDIGRDRGGDARDSAGMLAGEQVSASEFVTVADDLRGLGQNRDWRKPAHEVNRLAWEVIAALSVADKNGAVATDDEVRDAIRNDRSFAANGAFSFALYERILKEIRITPEHFEAFLKRRITLMRLAQDLVGSAAWVSPIELRNAVSDMTDSFTVRVAEFNQTPAEASAVKLDDAGLEKWYKDNTNSLALPERVKIRYVKYDATDPKVLARMSVSESEVHDLYDATVDKYTTTDTNGTEIVKKFEEVKSEVEKEARQIAAVQYFETNLNHRAYVSNGVNGTSQLEVIAKADGAKVETSDWFSLEGGYVNGFMRSAGSICPGANGFSEAVAELDPTSADLRYAVVSSDKAVWLIEKCDSSPAHVPSFAEAKDPIRPRALRAAQADALKKSVEAIIAKGTNAVCTTKNVSTNITFAICDVRSNEIPNQGAVLSAARKLKTGEMSDVVSVGQSKAIVVVCVARKEGDAAQATLLESQAREAVAQLQRSSLPEEWQKWNLERLGFEPNDVSSISVSEESVE